MTLRECAKFMIKESDNTAALMLNRYLEERIEAELHRIGADSTRYWHPMNTTTPNDILLVLKNIADPSYTSPQLSADMLELMTNTAIEDRLPQPLPEECAARGGQRDDSGHLPSDLPRFLSLVIVIYNRRVTRGYEIISGYGIQAWF
jgi:Beta-lactamase enzyme family